LNPTEEFALRAEFMGILAAGETLVNARGLISVFDADTGDLQHEFPSAVPFGWPRTPIVRPSEPVFAKRPFAMAIRPDGKRALVPFFQTGNAGVLDFDGQAYFPGFPLSPTAGIFQGLVAVTPTLKLDNFLWPINSEDVSLLFPTELEYAQNGRFAVVGHRGSALCQGIFATACEPRGAVSVIDDSAISTDLFSAPPVDLPGLANEKVLVSVPIGTLQQRYYSRIPVCKQVRAEAGNPVAVPSDHAFPACVKDVSAHVFGPSTFGVFKTVSGVAIEPIVSIISPKAGDSVWRTAPVHVAWQALGANITQVRYRITNANTNAVLADQGFDVVPLPGTGGLLGLFGATESEAPHVTFDRLLPVFPALPASIVLTVILMDGQEEVARTSVTLALRAEG